MGWLTFSIVLLCLLVSAFFSASETALTGASRASMLRLSKQGNSEATVVSSLMAMRERMIGALLLGNNIANIGASALATGIFTAWFGDVGVLYATGVMTVLVVIFAEVLPKTVAINAPDRVSLLVARPMRLTVLVLGPLLTIIEWIVRALMRLLGIKIGAHQAILSPTERLRGAVDLLHHEGKVEKQDRDMLGGLLDLSELQVSDVMVHRTEMTMVNADLPPEELVREVLASEYTRIPLWREKPENIVGVLHAKDLLRAMRANEGDMSAIDASAIALPPWFVPEMRPVSEQLKAFRRRKTHFALVVDEYGEVEGMVTLEDILEEIVGEFTTDPASISHKDIHEEHPGEYIINASATIRAINRALQWQLPTDGPKTLNGLLLEQLEMIPDPGTALKVGPYQFEVLQIGDNAIKTVRVKAESTATAAVTAS